MFKNIVYLIAILCLLPRMSVAATELLSVDNVAVEVSDAPTATLRDKALAQVSQNGFAQLAQQLVPSSSGKNAMPSDQELAAMLQDFEVVSERASSTRYTAIYNLRFRRQAVLHYLQNAGLNPRQELLQPLLLVPIIETQGSWQLMSVTDSRLAPLPSLLKLPQAGALPESLLALALEGQVAPELVQLLAQLKLTDGVLLIGAMPTEKDSQWRFARVPFTATEFAEQETLKATDFAAALTEIANQYQGSALNPEAIASNNIDIKVIYDNFGIWQEIQRRLRQDPMITGWQILRLGAQGASIKINSSAAIDNLPKLLSAQGLTLTPSGTAADGGWVLKLTEGNTNE